MTIIESIQSFIGSCPYINDFAKVVTLDSTTNNSSLYYIESIYSEPIIERYINGDSVRQYVFNFSSKESFGRDVIDNIKKSGFYENFSKWIEDETNKGNLPVLSEGKEPKRIETITTDYDKTETDKIKYKIRCRLIYFEDGGI